MEGVAANSALLFDYVEKFAGCTLSPIRLLGGGAQSSLWCQIYADTLDREVRQIDQPLLAQCRGAGLLAGAALGQYSLSDLPPPTATIFHPSRDDARFMVARAEEMKSMYERDKAWSRRHNTAP
jgi:xylulokinase